MTGRILIVGGTGEARDLAAALAERGREVISSLAGRVQNPALPTGAVRIGGFGGVEGMREWLTNNGIGAVVDASHPFATRISANTAAAAAAVGVPLLRLARPPWEPHPDDLWVAVPDIGAAAAAVAGRGRCNVLLTTGRQDVQAFADNAVAQFWIRVVDPPTSAVPARSEVITSRGPYELPDEQELLDAYKIDLLVTKNSGGALTYAKIIAARNRGIEVIVVDRPTEPIGVPSVSSVEHALGWLDLP